MESKIEWYDTSKKLPDNDELVLVCYYKKIKRIISSRANCYLIQINGFPKWIELATNKVYDFNHFNRWAYFPYPTE